MRNFNMAKKLALVTLDYPPENGGVARYLGNLVSFGQGAIEVFVNLTHAANGPGRVEPIELIRSGPWSWRPSIGSILKLREKGYGHVLISHALPLGTAAWISKMLGGLPYSIILHGLDLRLAVAHPRKAWLLKQVLRGAKNVIANSEFVAHEIRTFDSGLKPRVLTPAVEPVSRLDREAARSRLGVSADVPLIISVSRLVSRKGLGVLVRVMEKLPEAHLVIIGSGPERERLAAQVVAFNGRVRIISDASDEQRDEWYAAADVFSLLPRDEGDDVEGFGIVFLEAAARGLPSVAGCSGGVPEAVLDNVTGYLVDPLDEDAIASALKRLLDDATLRISMGREARARVERDFRWEDRVKELLGWVG